MSKILESIKALLLGIRSWRQAFIIISVATTLTSVALAGYWGYSMVERAGKLEVIAGFKAVELTKKQEYSIAKLIDPIVDGTSVGEFYVRVLQPDELIRKTSSELVYGKTDIKDWEVLQSSHWCNLTMALSETPAVLIHLNKMPVYEVQEGDDSYIGAYLTSVEHTYSNTYVHGMYFKNLLIGYCVVFIEQEKEGAVPESVLIKVDKAVRSINRIIFN